MEEEEGEGEGDERAQTAGRTEMKSWCNGREGERRSRRRGNKQVFPTEGGKDTAPICGEIEKKRQKEIAT